jgi:hypothetical protein
VARRHSDFCYQCRSRRGDDGEWHKVVGGHLSEEVKVPPPSQVLKSANRLRTFADLVEIAVVVVVILGIVGVVSLAAASEIDGGTTLTLLLALVIQGGVVVVLVRTARVFGEYVSLAVGGGVPRRQPTVPVVGEWVTLTQPFPTLEDGSVLPEGHASIVHEVHVEADPPGALIEAPDGSRRWVPTTILRPRSV